MYEMFNRILPLSLFMEWQGLPFMNQNSHLQQYKSPRHHLTPENFSLSFHHRAKKGQIGEDTKMARNWAGMTHSMI